MTNKLENYSIIIPAFNEERFMGKVIKEALKTKAGEIIIVNDGSQDNTEKIVLNFLQKEKRIKLVNHKTNRGYINALKSGKKYTSNDNLVFFDADIKNVKKWMFEKLKEPLLKNKTDLVLGAFDNFGRITEFTIRPLLKLFVKELAYLKQPLSGLFGIKKNFLFLQEKISKNEGYSLIQIFLTAYFKGARIKEVNLGKIIHDKREDKDKIKQAQSEVKIFFEVLKKYRKYDFFQIFRERTKSCQLKVFASSE